MAATRRIIMANDIFANIAANGIGGRMDQLCEIVPKKHEAAVCKFTDSEGAPIKTVPKMSTKAELYEALEKMKVAYKPFLADYAPKTESKRKRIYIKEFLLDGKEKINIIILKILNYFNKKTNKNHYHNNSTLN